MKPYCKTLPEPSKGITMKKKAELVVKTPNIFDAIVNTNGKLFEVVFIKKDGSLRKLLGKYGITRHLKKKNSKSFLRKDSIVVFDCEKKGYRTVKVDQVKSFSCGNVSLGV